MRNIVLRLQNINGFYPEHAISQLEEICSNHDGNLPNSFYLRDLGKRTISNLLKDLGYEHVSITAPEGATSSLREITLL